MEILEQFLFFFYMHANHVISHYLMTIAHKALFWRKTFSSSSWSRKNIYWSRTKSTRFFAKKMTRQTFWHKALVIDLLVCQKLLALKMCISLHYNYIFSTRYVRHNHSFESLSVLVKIASTYFVSFLHFSSSISKSISYLEIEKKKQIKSQCKFLEQCRVGTLNLCICM